MPIGRVDARQAAECHRRQQQLAGAAPTTPFEQFCLDQQVDMSFVFDADEEINVDYGERADLSRPPKKRPRRDSQEAAAWTHGKQRNAITGTDANNN